MFGSTVRVVVSKNVGRNSTFAVATRGTPRTFAVIYLGSDFVDVICATVLPYELVKVADCIILLFDPLTFIFASSLLIGLAN